MTRSKHELGREPELRRAFDQKLSRHRRCSLIFKVPPVQVPALSEPDDSLLCASPLADLERCGRRLNPIGSLIGSPPSV